MELFEKLESALNICASATLTVVCIAMVAGVMPPIQCDHVCGTEIKPNLIQELIPQQPPVKFYDKPLKRRSNLYYKTSRKECIGTFSYRGYNFNIERYDNMGRESDYYVHFDNPVSLKFKMKPTVLNNGITYDYFGITTSVGPKKTIHSSCFVLRDVLQAIDGI